MGDNPHDSNAVALYFEDIMLGYVPRTENTLIAQMLHYGHDVFECRVQQVIPEASPRAQVRVAIYVKDAR